MLDLQSYCERLADEVMNLHFEIIDSHNFQVRVEGEEQLVTVEMSPNGFFAIIRRGSARVILRSQRYEDVGRAIRGLDITSRSHIEDALELACGPISGSHTRFLDTASETTLRRTGSRKR